MIVSSTASVKTPVGLKSFRRRLLAWYFANRRALPWRKTRDPYRIWVSEIMLQQTRVAAVLDHYKQFLKRFPTVRHLAASREAEVLAAWSGLGYYRRARMMHGAAKQILAEHGGRLPKTSSELQQLSGIGRYTANAISSIAFAQAVAVVDGNVERVLNRMSPNSLSGEQLWNAAQHLLDPANPGDFNQAMMELGATICVPGTPLCTACPIKKHCASRNGVARRARLGEARARRSAMLLLQRQGNSVLLRRRSERESLMPGMWEFPQIASAPPAAPILKVRHSITITDWTVEVFTSGEPGTNQQVQWIPASRMKELPLTGLTRKILRKLNLLA